MSQPHIVILGAGPAGVGAAYQLRRLDRARVTVLEQQAGAGGNAGSFELDGLRVDYGSHRLHPACAPAILADIRGLLGGDLLDRPRHGRIRLRGRWIHFPLEPLDLLLRLDRGFAFGSLRDALLKPFRRAPAQDSFAGVLTAGLGPTICNSFYFPYSRKIWGRDPQELSEEGQLIETVEQPGAEQLARKLFGRLPGLRQPGGGGGGNRFFYPRHGYGQLSEAYAQAARAAGAVLRFEQRVTRVTPPAGRHNDRWVVEVSHAGRSESVEADQLWSTLPLPVLARLLGEGGYVPPEVLEAAGRLEYRAMLLIYLVLPVARFSEFDAHYFPGAEQRLTRLSEPKNYAALSTPVDRTVLCAELPCEADEAVWSMSDEELGNLVAADLTRAGIPLPAAPLRIAVRRLRQAYPIYGRGYERWFGRLDRWVESLSRCVSYGRQGLFAHDNTHHALAMAYAAADCIQGFEFRRDRWAAYRREFETHVVED